MPKTIEQKPIRSRKAMRDAIDRSASVRNPTTMQRAFQRAAATR